MTPGQTVPVGTPSNSAEDTPIIEMTIDCIEPGDLVFDADRDEWCEVMEIDHLREMSVLSLGAPRYLKHPCVRLMIKLTTDGPIFEELNDGRMIWQVKPCRPIEGAG